MANLGKSTSDLPPLLPPGSHDFTMARLRRIGVDLFPRSIIRGQIFEGFEKIVCAMVQVAIQCELVIDGSFLTEEIEPDDIDFAVCIETDIYERCSNQQLELLHWIRDDFTIKATHLSDCYLSVQYAIGHPEWFEGIQDRAFWINMFAKSVVYRRNRGVAIIRLDGGLV